MITRSGRFFGFTVAIIAFLLISGVIAIWYGNTVVGLLTLILGVLVSGILSFNFLIYDYIQKSLNHQKRMEQILENKQKVKPLKGE